MFKDKKVLFKVKCVLLQDMVWKSQIKYALPKDKYTYYHSFPDSALLA